MDIENLGVLRSSAHAHELVVINNKISLLGIRCTVYNLSNRENILVKDHTKILVWENDKRLNKLIEFRDLVVQYFNNQTGTVQADFQNKNTENKPVQITSTDINLALVEIHHIITSSGISTKFIYTAPPFLGGRSTKFDLIFDMFNLYEFGIPPQKVVDIIEISIGVYESNRTKSISRMFNPFFWLGWVADAISEVLFDVMGEFGSGRQNAEKSAIGKISKGIIYFVTNIVVPLLLLLQLLDLLEPVKQFVHKIL